MERLRGPYPSGRLLRASKWLTGTVEPKLMRTAFEQQGLLQIYADFLAIPATEAAAKIFRQT
jgi:hypothetical protein